MDGFQYSSFRADELKFFIFTTNEMNSIMFKSLKCLESYPQINELSNLIVMDSRGSVYS